MRCGIFHWRNRNLILKFDGIGNDDKQDWELQPEFYGNGKNYESKSHSRRFLVLTHDAVGLQANTLVFSCELHTVWRETGADGGRRWQVYQLWFSGWWCSASSFCCCIHYTARRFTATTVSTARRYGRLTSGNRSTAATPLVEKESSAGMWPVASLGLVSPSFSWKNWRPF